MLCADEVWKRALDGLIERAHTVVMDLSLFSKGRLGCEYELRQLLDRIPLGQIVLITGRRTDEQLLVSALNDIWNTMPEDSPNGRDMSSSLLLVKSRYLRSRLRSVSSSSPGERPSPAERERDSLRLLLGLPTD